MRKSLETVYEYNGSRASLTDGCVVNSSLIDARSGGLLALIETPDKTLTQATNGLCRFSLRNGSVRHQPIDYIGAGHVSAVSRRGRGLCTRAVTAFAVNGQIYLIAARGLPPLSGISITFDVAATVSHRLTSIPPLLVKGTPMENQSGPTPIKTSAVGPMLLALARNRRVAAVNAHPRLAYVARLRDHMGLQHEIAFATSTEFESIERNTHENGLCSKIEVLDMNVRAIKPRPLVLSPCQRIKAYHPMAIAAE
jgi:hypothetical protein